MTSFSGQESNTFSNIPKSISDLLERKLHNQRNHPIEIIKRKIYSYFLSDPIIKKGYKFATFDHLSSIVTTEDNFDKLLIPKSHPARSKSDTYYVDETHVLRTHTSAHQNELLAKGYQQFLVTGDVYRKDEVDAKHYPVFHQMEMLAVLPDHLGTEVSDTSCVKAETAPKSSPEIELKSMISGLIEFLFPICKYRFGSDYFPFTDPSFEVEVEYNGGWLEILGCGVVQPKILEANGIVGKKAIAFGIGLERLVMTICGIPDIRYLWSTHPRFLYQFEDGQLKTFVPFSVLPEIIRDISFFISETRLAFSGPTDTDDPKAPKWLDENDFFELARECSGNIMKEVRLFDSFHNKKKNLWSRSYRCTYAANSPDQKSPDEFCYLVNGLQEQLRERVKSLPELTLR